VNDLLGVVADSNVFIQESKVATCDVRPGPRPRGQELVAMLAETRARAGVTVGTGTHIATADDGLHVAHTDDDTGGSADYSADDRSTGNSAGEQS
jgi:formate dehydrogenase major subunit